MPSEDPPESVRLCLPAATPVTPTVLGPVGVCGMLDPALGSESVPATLLGCDPSDEMVPSWLLSLSLLSAMMDWLL